MADGPKKFGAFSGVFTPSILTILGVIMYLRLGWVAGVAGLAGIVAIILLAHVISFTTGLSISSIATDKKIKAGGIYYILSRSLGLPMGGSIGITLFVGTALSISLYIIGFTESFMSLPVIRDWFDAMGLAPDSLNTTRITGTVVLVLLVIIAFISTDVAIKTQFLILTAIALSLISIFVGFFVHSDLSSQFAVVDFSPFKDFSFEVVFAVFFPAVTGFTAGVAMSGDLKDPKKDIPKGTMWAIIIGFVVYLVLGISFVLFVDRGLLLNDYNFLLKMAWIPVLVIAGIWGATLSSALGGILGGPRIIQAVANDHIVPRFLGKGYGLNNEPRNALIFTFILSELGILIGDLNIIAGIVTMFYLTAYGFINLAFALEKWASSDFRPSFQVPVWVGIIGFVVSFMIMFKLDMVSMFAAFIILGGIFYYINRKHFHRPMTSVWQSVNTSIVRNILNKLDKEKPDERNWRPNILLFSGGTRNRPHLIEFGKALVARQGMISNFDLILNESSEYLFPKNKQTLSDSDTKNNEGLFSRRLECNDIYHGIETIASVYGFSGVEPNTVLMGWGRNSSKPIEFVKMIKRLVSLDLNVVLLDYDKKRGFGNYSLIDVWWRGGSNNGNFILSLIKFIKSTYEWRNARVRIMIVNPKIENKSWIERDARNVLANMRIEAEVRVINNEIDKRPIYDIIKQESINSDLVFLGFPDITSGKEEEFIKATDRLCKDIGTTVLVKASSLFKELHIGINPGLQNLEVALNTQISNVKIPELSKPVSAGTAAASGKYYGETVSFVNKLLKQYLDPIFENRARLLDGIKEKWQRFYGDLHRDIKLQNEDLRSFITKKNLHLVAATDRITKSFYKKEAVENLDKIKSLTEVYLQVAEKINSTLPDEFEIVYTDAEAEKLINSGRLTETEAAMLRDKRKFVVDTTVLKEHVLLADLAPAWLEMLKELGYANYLIEIKLSKLNDLIEEYQVGKYYSKVEYKEVIETLIKKEASFTNLITELKENNKQSRNIAVNTLIAGITRSFNKSVALLETPEGWKKYPKTGVLPAMKKAKKQIQQFEEVWSKNQQIISKARMVSWQLLAFKLRLRWLLLKDIYIFNGYFSDFKNDFLLQAQKIVEEQKANLANNKGRVNIELPTMPRYIDRLNENYNCNKKIVLSLLNGLPAKVRLFSDSKFRNYKELQFDLKEEVTLELSGLLTYIINNDLLRSLKDFHNSIDKILTDEYLTVKKEVEQLNHAQEKDRTVLTQKVCDALVKTIETNDKRNEDMELRIKERLNAVWDKVTLSSLSIQSEVLQYYIREEKYSQRKNFLKRFFVSKKKQAD